MRQYLGESIEDYNRWRQGRRLALGTLRNERIVLSRLAKVCGPILTGSLRENHVEAHWADAAVTRTSSLAIDYATLRGFLGWCARTGRITDRRDLMLNIVPPPQSRRERRRISANEFPRLLDSADHPRDRMVLALGVYSLQRSNEIAATRIGDVLFDTSEILSRISKGRRGQVREIYMPICAELDTELRRWLTYYTEQQGPLQPEWFLVPAKYSPKWEQDPESGKFIKTLRKTDHLKPVIPWRGNRAVVAKQALEAIGFPVTDPTGKGVFEGMHTLRRSGARALYDRYVADGEADAVGLVQQMLNHESRSMTERYIGVTSQRTRLRQTLAGKIMYPVDRSNVLSLPGSSRAVGDQQKEAAYGTPS